MAQQNGNGTARVEGISDPKRRLQAILDYDWPLPNPHVPGLEYLWVPHAGLSAVKKQGWKSTPDSCESDAVGVMRDYFMFKRGTPMHHVKPHMCPPDVSVWDELVEDVEVEGPVSARERSDLRPGEVRAS